LVGLGRVATREGEDGGEQDDRWLRPSVHYVDASPISEKMNPETTEPPERSQVA
jgi:hypothetical protein